MIDTKRMSRKAKLPIRAHKTDAGRDLFAIEAATLRPGETLRMRTGIAVRVPEGHVGLVKGKSGLANLGLLILGGVIDEGYIGEIQVILASVGGHTFNFNVGSPVAQLLFVECSYDDCGWVDNLESTERGAGGFGSTAKMLARHVEDGDGIKPGSWVRMRNCVDGLFSDCVGLVIGMYRSGNDVFARVRWNDRLACPRLVSVAIQNLDLTSEPKIFQLDDTDDNGC